MKITDKHRFSGAVTHLTKGRVILLPDWCVICSKPTSKIPAYENTIIRDNDNNIIGFEYASRWRTLFCASCEGR